MTQEYFTPETLIEKTKRLDLERLPKAWAEFITPYNWDHVVTLTFSNFSSRYSKYSSSDPSVLLSIAFREFEWWIRTLERSIHGTIDYVVAPEFTTAGHIHFHGLISGTKGLTVDFIDDKWRVRPSRKLNTTGNGSQNKRWVKRGNAKIVVYRSNGGAEKYLTKKITPDWSEIRHQLRGPALKNMPSA